MFVTEFIKSLIKIFINIINKGDNMEFIFMLFDRYGLIMLFVIVLLEYSCFPLPSEIVLPLLGCISSKNFYSLYGVIFMSVIFGYIGSLVCYLIGYYGGSKLYNKIYNKMPKWRKGLDSSYSFFYKYGNVSVLIGRIIPMCRTYVSLFAGLFKQSLFKYSFYSLIGITMWNTILITLGYYLSDKLSVVENCYGQYKLFCLIIVVCVILFFFFIKMYKKFKKTKTINGD